MREYALIKENGLKPVRVRVQTKGFNQFGLRRKKTAIIDRNKGGRGEKG